MEVQLTINTKLIERVIFVLIIIALGVALYMQGGDNRCLDPVDTAIPEEPEVNESEPIIIITTDEPEEPEEEPEEEEPGLDLSGELDISLGDIDFEYLDDDDLTARVTSIEFIIENGLDEVLDLKAEIYIYDKTNSDYFKDDIMQDEVSLSRIAMGETYDKDVKIESKVIGNLQKEKTVRVKFYESGDLVFTAEKEIDMS